MKLIINTKKKTIEEKPHKIDSKIDPVVAETILANQLALIIATQAHRNYKKREVREQYIRMVCCSAMRILDKLDRNTSAEERLLRNIFGEDSIDNLTGEEE